MKGSETPCFLRTFRGKLSSAIYTVLAVHISTYIILCAYTDEHPNTNIFLLRFAIILYDYKLCSLFYIMIYIIYYYATRLQKTNPNNASVASSIIFK